MAWFDPVAPSDGLEGILACSWTAHPSGTHRLVPDGCLDLLWISTGQLVLCGPETTAWTFSLPLGTEASGVRFRPGAAPALLGFDASSMLDRRQGVGPMIGSDGEARLCARLADAAGVDAQRRVLEAFVFERSRKFPPDTAMTDAIVELIVEQPRSTTDDIAAAVGLTVRQLHRRCLVGFGYGVKTLARLIRFQRFLAVIESGTGCGLAAAASDAGYSDHAHLARDCRAITGLTPRQFLGDYFPTFPDMSDPFKTPSPLVAKLAP